MTRSNIHNISERRTLSSNSILTKEMVLNELQDTTKVLDIAYIQRLYDKLNITSREEMLAEMSKSKAISTERKSMMLQSAHYSENGAESAELSIYIMLAIYWKLKGEKSQPAETNSLIRKFLGIRGSNMDMNLASEKIDTYMDYLGKDPWKMNGNDRVGIRTSLLATFAVRSKTI